MPGEGNINSKLQVAQAKRKARLASPAHQYTALPVAQRQAQLASRGVLQPTAAKQIRQVHAKRITQLKTSPAARQRLDNRQLAQALATAAHTMHAAKLTKVQPQTGGSTLATIGGGLTHKVLPLGAALTNPLAAAGAGIAAAVDKAAGTHILKGIAKTVANIPSDAAELAVTTPSSLAKFGETAVTHPLKVPGMLAQPYIDLAKHPLRTLEEHPVSTALMVAPVAKVPGAAAGRVARIAGKQTLERIPAQLAGTALKEQRFRSPDYFVNQRQARADIKAGGNAPAMTDKQVQRRVDEFVDTARLHRNRVANSITRDIKNKGLTGDAATERFNGAVGGAQRHTDRRMVEEFGMTWRPGPGGTILKPKGPGVKGVLHQTKADAQTVADKAPIPVVVREVNGKYGVIPKTVADRLKKHAVVGTSQALPAKVMRTSRAQFTQTVLPLSPKWLFGQVSEAGLRSLVARAGPKSAKVAHRVVEEMNRQEPGSGTRLLVRAAGSGHFGPTGAIREFQAPKTLAGEYKGTPLQKPADFATKVGATKPALAARRAWHSYTETVFRQINGSIERRAQTAMLGRAIRQSPLMETQIRHLSRQAIEDAARGLHNTESQVALARSVDRMYGRYSKFSPDMRSFIQHWTPFLPWTVNTLQFLGRVLPADHPVLTAAVASADKATEDWRKSQQLSLHGKHVPGYLLGSTPTGHGGFRRFGRYMPFFPGGDIGGTVTGLLLPQFQGLAQNVQGKEWTGAPMKGNRLAETLATAAETFAPGVSQVGNITGLSGHYVRKTGEPSVVQGKNVLQGVNQQFNPFAATKPKPKKARRSSASGTQWSQGGGGGVQWNTGGPKVTWR